MNRVTFRRDGPEIPTRNTASLCAAYRHCPPPHLAAFSAQLAYRSHLLLIGGLTRCNLTRPDEFLLRLGTGLLGRLPLVACWGGSYWRLVWAGGSLVWLVGGTGGRLARAAWVA